MNIIGNTLFLILDLIAPYYIQIGLILLGLMGLFGWLLERMVWENGIS